MEMVASHRRARAVRVKRRLAVHFVDTVTKAARRGGYTVDISETGVFVQTQRPPTPGTAIELQVMLKSGRELVIYAVVARLVVPPRQFVHALPSGFGARFTSAVPALAELI